MKKFLLMIAAGLFAVQGISANEVEYYYSQDGSSWKYGSIRRISENGRYAVATDEYEFTGSILVDTEDMANPIYDNDGEFMDVSNDGVIAGQHYRVIGEAHYLNAAYWKDGKWYELDQPEGTFGRSWATSISYDSRVISGYIACYYKGTEANGKYYPAQWFLNDETGSYDLVCYNDLDLPDHPYGFITYDCTDDGSTMVGMLHTYLGGSIPAIVKDGQLKYWNKLEVVEMPWYYKDKIMGYDWESVVDGYHETGDDDFSGCFLSVDSKGYCYGYRTVVTDVNPETMTGNLHHYSTVYDLNTDTFVDTNHGVYLAGYDGKVLFDANGEIFKDGKGYKITTFFDMTLPDDLRPGGFYCTSGDGKFVGGGSLWYNDVIEGYEEIATLVKLDEPLLKEYIDTAVKNVSMGEVNVNVEGKVITVSGAENVAVYSLGGALVGNGRKTAVEGGIYIVRADDKALKVLVK